MKRQGLGLVLALCVGLSMMAWAVQYPLEVTDISIKGTVEIKDEEILEVLGFVVGDEVVEADLKAASRAIFDLGWFGEVVPEVTEGGGITFRVTENPVIRKIVITGNTHRETYSILGIRLFSLPAVPTSKIQQILYEADVRKRKVLSRVALEQALADVIEEYNNRGYVLVAIGDVKLEETLEIEIIEGRVSGHDVVGLTTVPRAVAEGLIDIPLGEPLRLHDAQRVVSALRRSVYFADVNVTPKPGEGHDGVVLQWELEERILVREPVEIEGITLRGISRYEEPELESLLGEIPTGPIDNYGILRILQAVSDRYADDGYMMARFISEGVEDGTLRIRIDEGRVGEIVIAGATRTKEYVIRRKLEVEVGEVLSRADFLVSHQNLRSLGYFASVDLTPEWIEDSLRLTVNVRDKARLGGLEGSMALDPKTGGVVGELKVRQRNLFGTGQDVTLSYSRGLALAGEPGRSTWDLAYTSTAFFSGFDRVGLDLYRTTKEVRGEDETSSFVIHGGTASFAFPVADYVDLGLSYRHERERVLGEVGWIPTDSVSLSLTYDDVGDPSFPTDGTRRSIKAEKAGGFAPGREYSNLGVTWIDFREARTPLFGTMRQALATRIKVGFGDDNLPTSQLYELGGEMSVRGLETQSVPRIFLLNTEYRVELAEEGLYLSTFFDAGLDLDRVRWDAVLSSLGLEFSVSAMGVMVRLDVAWPLGQGWSWVPQFEIGFGKMF